MIILRILLSLLLFLPSVNSSTIITITSSSITQRDDFTMRSGFRVIILSGYNGYQLDPLDGQQSQFLPPGIFRVSTINTDSGSIRITRVTTATQTQVQSSFRFLVQSGFRVVRTRTDRFTLAGANIDIPSNSFTVEQDGTNSNQARITVAMGGSSSSTTTNNNNGNGNTNPNNPNNPQPTQQQNAAPLRDKTKSDGTTDCGPSIAYLCFNDLYAQLMRDQCPATCANANAPATANVQAAPAPASSVAVAAAPVVGVAPVAVQSPLIYRPWGIFGGMRIGGCGRGRK